MTSLNQIEKVAKSIDKKILATDLVYLTKIIHNDGTCIFFDSSIAVEHDEWYIVFTEHHGTSFYHKEDLNRISMYKKVDLMWA